jgi:hypothetical protein
MRGYDGMDRSTSACVRFVRNTEVDADVREAFAELGNAGIRRAYVDLRTPQAGDVLANQVARALQLEHAPYTHKHWVCFLDDLVTLAHREKGLVIVVDGAWLLIEQRRNEFFDLIEAFLVQFHHWLERAKPCYLCLQMEPNSHVSSFFAQGDV